MLNNSAANIALATAAKYLPILTKQVMQHANKTLFDKKHIPHLSTGT